LDIASRIGILALVLAAAGVGQPSTHKLVTVNAVVTDKLGRSISGLISDDFRVFDNDDPQTISFFRQTTGAPQKRLFFSTC
jgi:hypothetical protein